MPRCLDTRAFAAIREKFFNEPYNWFGLDSGRLVKRFFCSEEREKRARAMPACFARPRKDP